MRQSSLPPLPVVILAASAAMASLSGCAQRFGSSPVDTPTCDEMTDYAQETRARHTVRDLDHAMQLYDESLLLIQAEDWDRAYENLDHVIRTAHYTDLGREPDSLIHETYRILKTEASDLAQAIEPYVSDTFLALLPLPNPAPEEPDVGEAVEVPEPVQESTDDADVLPFELNERIRHYLAYFIGPRKEATERIFGRANRYLPMIERVLSEEGVPLELGYLPVVESAMRPTAVSRARAVGLWQFIASTGRMYDLEIGEFIDERRDPEKATRAAARHLADLYERFGSWELSLAAYNCGAGRVKRAIKRAGTNDYWKLRLPRETRNYVPQFYATVLLARDPQAYGLEVEPDAPTATERAIAPALVDTKFLAKGCGITPSEFERLNPELYRHLTPPRDETVVHIPEGRGERFRIAMANIQPNDRAFVTHHRVRKGETLSQLASRYRTTVDMLVAANGLHSRHKIRVGRNLVIPVRTTGSVTRTTFQADHHVVRPGETLSGIAHNYRVPLDELLAVNGLGLQAVIHPGKRLRMPVVSGTHTHRVRPGDTLSGIATRYQTTVSILARSNGIDESALIYPGLKLRVPSSAREGAAKHIHHVRSGESVYLIARRYGVSTKDVIAWNSLDPQGRIHPGDRLTVWMPREG